MLLIISNQPYFQSSLNSFQVLTYYSIYATTLPEAQLIVWNVPYIINPALNSKLDIDVSPPVAAFVQVIVESSNACIALYFSPTVEVPLKQ